MVLGQQTSGICLHGLAWSAILAGTSRFEHGATLLRLCTDASVTIRYLIRITSDASSQEASESAPRDCVTAQRPLRRSRDALRKFLR
jgi:hypothetical protein